MELDSWADDLGSQRTAPVWVTPSSADADIAKQARCKPRRNRQRLRRQEEKALRGMSSPSAADGGAPELPPHLRRYGRQVRADHEFSGPSLLAAESEEGCVEYKLRLSTANPARFQQLVTQLKFRLAEGGGECYYYVGVEDNGHPCGLGAEELRASLAALDAMAAEVAASAAVLHTPPGVEGRRCAVVRVRGLSASGASHEDLRVAVAGGVDSGKSTLVSVLTHGAGGRAALDNGRGSARMNVFRHKHEIESGRTSSISHQLLGYDAGGGVLNYGHKEVCAFTPRELAQAAARVVRFADLGGHEKYSKTSLYGMTCTLPDYAMLCVCAATGLTATTLEHLAVALALGVPPFVVLTKVDLSPPGRVEALAAELAALVAAARRRAGGQAAAGSAAAPRRGSGRPAGDVFDELAPMVRSEAEARAAAEALGRRRAGPAGPADIVVPVFPASSVTGASLTLLHAFLTALPPSEAAGTPRGSDAAACAGGATPLAAPHAAERGSPPGGQPAHFQVDNTFEVAGVGSVMSGTMLRGRVAVGCRLLLGPSDTGDFAAVRVTGIQRSQVDVDAVCSGQHATLAIQPEIPDLKDAPPAGCQQGDGSSGTALHGAPAKGGPALGACSSSSSSSINNICGELRPGTPPLDGAAAAGVELCSSLPRRPLEPSSSSSSSSAALDVCRPSSYRCLASEEDLAHLGRSWEFAQRLQPSGLAAGAPPAGASPRCRKGTVLVDPGLDPRPALEFEAVVVLLGGSWPPRGLLSGRYPPNGDSDVAPKTPLRRAERAPDGGSAPGSGSGSESGPGGRSPGHPVDGLRLLERARSHGRLSGFVPVVHCGGVRQAAQVVWIQEQLGGPQSCGSPTAAGGPSPTAAQVECIGFSSVGRANGGLWDADAIAAGLAAAGVLSSWVSGGSPCPERGPNAGGALHRQLSNAASAAAQDDLGCVCRVRFRFTQRAEWLVPGARLILRDRGSGRVAGAGVVALVEFEQAKPRSPESGC